MRSRSLLLMFGAGIVVALVLVGNPSELNESSRAFVETIGEPPTESAAPERGAPPAAPAAPGEDVLAAEPFGPGGFRADDEQLPLRTAQAPSTTSVDTDERERNGASPIPLDGRVRLRDEMVALHEKLEGETQSAWGQAKEAELFNYLMSKRPVVQQFGAYDGFSVRCRETVCEIQVRGTGADPFGAWNAATADIGAQFPEFAPFVQGGAFLNPAGSEVALVMIGERKTEAATRSTEPSSARS